MDTADLRPLLEELEGNIDDLEETLEPILRTVLSESAGKLPVLDKAKFYVLITYAIESILFSYIRLNGVDAKEHPVYTELSRVKQYFAKIKVAETGPVKRQNMNLDKGAAGRIIKHGLAGNEKYDQERAAQQAREKLGAEQKLKQLSEPAGDDGAAPASKKRASEAMLDAEGITKKGKRRSKKKKSGHNRGIDDKQGTGPDTDQVGDTQTEISNANGEEAHATSKAEELILPRKSNQPPKAPSEAFQALLKGPIPNNQPETPKKKRRKKSNAAS